MKPEQITTRRPPFADPQRRQGWAKPGGAKTEACRCAEAVRGAGAQTAKTRGGIDGFEVRALPPGGPPGRAPNPAVALPPGTLSKGGPPGQPGIRLVESILK